MTEEQAKERKAEHETDVLAHIAAHEAAGQTEAVEKHMAVTEHKTIVESAKLTEGFEAKLSVGGEEVPLTTLPGKDEDE